MVELFQAREYWFFNLIKNCSGACILKAINFQLNLFTKQGAE